MSNRTWRKYIRTRTKKPSNVPRRKMSNRYHKHSVSSCQILPLQEFQKITPRHKNCYATLIFKGDLYVGGCLVWAHTLRAVKPKADLVVMHTADVSYEAREDMALYFDYVVLVDYLDAPVIDYPGRRFKENYAWISLAFTKLRAFALTPYEKVIMMDCDMMFKKNTDELFKLNTPAGICSILTKEKDARMHGKHIPAKLVQQSLRSYGIRGCCYLIKPDASLVETIMDSIPKNVRYGDRNLFIGPDEQILTEFFLKEWTHISHKYGCPTWKEKDLLAPGVKASVYHFVSEKPWKTTQEWEEFEWWDTEAKKIVREHKETLKHFSMRKWAMKMHPT